MIWGSFVVVSDDENYETIFFLNRSYRKAVKALEEGKSFHEELLCDIPERTNPELVMYCRRDYDYNLHRILKIRK